MANETAGTFVPLGREGTGYATILENKILPSLQNEQRRADRLWQMEQAAKAAAAKEAARRAAEDAKYVPQFEATQGGFFMPRVQEANKRDLEQVRAIFRNPAATTQMKQEAANAYNTMVKERNSWQQFNDQQLQKALPETQKYYRVDESDVARYAGDFQGDPFSVNHPARFYETISKDPNRFKWREVGQALFKPIGENKVEYVNSNGQVVSFERSKILKPTGQFRTNPVTKSKEPIMGIDYDVALDAAQGDPEVVKAITNYADLRIPQLAQAMPNASDEQLKEIAGKEAMDKLFAGLGGAVYKQDVTTEYGKARQRAQAAEDVKTVESDVDISVNYQLPGTKSPVRLNWGRGADVRPSKPVPVGAGRRVYLLGGDINQIKPLQEAGVISERQPDGSYILNFGFNVKEYQEPQNVLQLVKPTRFDMGGGRIVTRQPGDFITPKEAAALRKNGFGSNFRTVAEGYRISPASFQVNEETETLMGPAFQIFDMFVPKGTGQLPELDNVPRKSGKKSKPDIGL